ncbi:MAG: DUF6463 family protein [Burkholderiaceae bacterium]|nr:DUF6463 family protein [Burkholderiaceae bacterium]
MLSLVAWILVVLGVVHCLLGLVVFRKPIVAALREGIIGKFAGIPERRLAFWFTAFGPLLLMSGHLAVTAVTDGDMASLQIIGLYLFGVSVMGTVALPKSPFPVTALLSAFIVAASMGWIS